MNSVNINGVDYDIDTTTELDLGNTQVSDVAALAALVNLKWLYLSNTQVNDVAALAALVNLKELDLSITQVSDIAALAALTSLIIYR